MLSCIILAGGLGTRLQIVSKDLPKCMVNIGGHPFLHWLLTALYIQEVDNVVLALGYKPKNIIDYCNKFNNVDFSFDFNYNIEEELLGTGGAIRNNICEVIGDTVLILNGDSFCRFNIQKLLDIHLSSNAKATILLTKLKDTSEYGNVSITKDGKVIEFVEKTGEKAPGLVNVGVYILNNPGILDYIPEGIVSLEREVFPKLAKEGSLYTITTKDPLFDIGTPERCNVANKFFMKFGGDNDFSEYIRKNLL